MKFNLIYGIHTIDLNYEPHEHIHSLLNNTYTFNIAHACYTQDGKQPPFGLKQEVCIKNAQSHVNKYMSEHKNLNPVFKSKLDKVLKEEWGYFAETPNYTHGCCKDIIYDGPTENQMTMFYIKFEWDDMSWGHWWEETIKKGYT